MDLAFLICSLVEYRSIFLNPILVCVQFIETQYFPQSFSYFFY